MALAALIAAYHESGEAGALRATLPLAGRTLIERQVRLAASAGAVRIVIIVERMPPALSEAIDRLRRNRLPIHVARSAEQAAEAIDPSDRLLMIGDGAIADGAEMMRLAESEGPAVLTVPDSGYGEIYERIDGATRWGGIVAVDGAMLRQTASMLRDWDLQSTLLRRALQNGARHVAASGPVAILDGRDDLVGLERKILSAAAGTSGSWAERLLAPFERLATALLMSGPVGAAPLGIGSALLTGLGAAAFAYQWFWTGLVLLLAATPIEGVAGRLARIRMQDDAGRHWWTYLNPAFAGGALVALSYALVRPFGWGMALLAFTTLAFLIALGIESAGREVRGRLFLAERKGLVWLMLPFAILGAWNSGLALLFAYAAGSFFWAQQQAHARG